MSENNHHNNTIKISIDAMGGDYAPQSTVEGAMLAAKEFNIPSILVGNEPQILEELSKHGYADLPIEIKHASEVFAMDEPPLNIIRKKKDCSLRIAFDLVKSGESQA
ncbi:MAG: phosphate--acyl-ACP acyltransferase, partial [Deltaproteobacteria bacterium]|nr:phosphate--acyl-ACP acyltransferase [Deltaproteobacteria bacterium]